MRNLLLLSLSLASGLIITGCNSGSTSNGGSNEPFQQWTNQIGGASVGGGRIRVF